MNILSWRGEFIILEEGSQRKCSKQHLQGRVAHLQVPHRAMGTVQCIQTLPRYCLTKETTAFHSSLHWIPEQPLPKEHPGVAELEQEKGLGMRGILPPCPPQLPLPFVPLFFSQLQPHPISEQVTDSSQNLTTWPLSIGITIKPPGPEPDGK